MTGAALAILAALAVAWLLMMLLFGRHLERRMAADLSRSGGQLVAAATTGTDYASALRDALSDPRLQVPGGGLYWQVTLPDGQVIRSRSLWDQDLAGAPGRERTEWAVRRATDPFGEGLLVVERQVQLPGASAPLHVQVAEDARELTSAQRQFGRELAAFLALLWLALSGAAWLQVLLGLRPLAQVRAEVEALRLQPQARISGADLQEIEPLTKAINDLLDARAHDLARARRRAADMAHGLKTPLAAMSAQVRRLPAEMAAVEGLRRSIAAIQRTVSTELARSRIAASQSDAYASAEVRSIVQQLVAVLSHTDHGGKIQFEVDLPRGLTVPMAAADLTEVLGAVLENATRHAVGIVRISAQTEGSVRVAVDDDGLGLEPVAIEAVKHRAERLDESASLEGGLGLAIVFGLMDASGGAVHLGRSRLGGLRVELVWKSRDMKAA